MADAMHLQRLIAAAEDLGADRAAPVPAAAVIVDERVNLKCRVPLCSGYGHNLMCPPVVMPPAETRGVLAKYGDALVVQLDIPLTQDCVDEQLNGRTYAEARSDADQITGLRESQNRFAHLMTDLERAAFKLGYRYAAAFSGGECVLCDECVGQGTPARRAGTPSRPDRPWRPWASTSSPRPRRPASASSCRPRTIRPGPAFSSSIESMTSDLIITGAREHNLKNIDLETPARPLVVITGLSGSGKSSLAFDTIYAEGQRRYVESLSAYARQFLGQMEKPDVDYIEGLSPAISIEQKTTSAQPALHRRHRHRDLRLPAPALRPHRAARTARSAASASPRRPCSRSSTASCAAGAGHALHRARAGRPRPQGRVPQALRRSCAREGFARVRVDGEVRELDEPTELDKKHKHDIEVVVDRLVAQGRPSGGASPTPSRPPPSWPTASSMVELARRRPAQRSSSASSSPAPTAASRCPRSQPRIFSFNSPLRRLPRLHGLGTQRDRPRPASCPTTPSASRRRRADPVTASRLRLLAQVLESARPEDLRTSTSTSPLERAAGGAPAS